MSANKALQQKVIAAKEELEFKSEYLTQLTKDSERVAEKQALVKAKLDEMTAIKRDSV
jgi:hypothetical protein